MLVEVFAEVLECLIDEGYVKLETYFVAGTEVEANPSRYRYATANDARRYRAQPREKLGALPDEIEQVNEQGQAE